MKKLILIFLIASVTEISAQSTNKNKYEFGCKIGEVNATVTGGRVKSAIKSAFEIGLWIRLKMNKNWSVQTEAFLILKGTGAEIGRNKVARAGQYSISLYYYEFPMLFQYHRKNFTLEFGPGLGILQQGVENLTGALRPDLTDNYPFIGRELSFNLGIAYSLNQKWNLGLRYTNSLLPIRIQIPDIPKQMYNQVLAVILTRQLNFKRTKDEESTSQE